MTLTKLLKIDSKPLSLPQNESDLDDRALSILQICHSDKLKDQNQVLNWLLEIESQLANQQKITLNQFSALTYMVKSNYFLHLDLGGRNLKYGPKQLLRIAYVQISEVKVCEFNETETDLKSLAEKLKLKSRVLKKYPREQILIYQSLFHELNKSTWGSLKVIWQDYSFKWKDLFLFSLIVMATFSSSLFRILLSGFTLGYLFSTMMEYLVHRYIGHATVANKKFLKLLGPIGQDMLNFNLEHSIHHGSVHHNYTKIFSPSGPSTTENLEKQKNEKQKVIQFLKKKGGTKLVQMVENSNFGLSSSNIYRTQLFFLPVTLITLFLPIFVIAFESVVFNIVFSIGFLLSSQLWILTSSSYHPYLHFTEKEVNDKAPWYWKMFLKTRLSRFIALSHRMHHYHGGQLNQNLNIGFDFLIRWQPITFTQLLEMKKSEVIF